MWGAGRGAGQHWLPWKLLMLVAMATDTCITLSPSIIRQI